MNPLSEGELIRLMLREIDSDTAAYLFASIYGGVDHSKDPYIGFLSARLRFAMKGYQKEFLRERESSP